MKIAEEEDNWEDLAYADENEEFGEKYNLIGKKVVDRITEISCNKNIFKLN